MSLNAGSRVLEPLSPAHADEMYVLLRDPELYRHLDYPPPPSVEHLRSVYERLASRRSPDGAEDWLNWVIRTEGGVVGYVQATVEPSRRAWVAYVLGSAHRGRGHASAATRAMIEHLAHAYGATCFVATVEAANEPSIRLLERLGFRQVDEEEARAHNVSPSERMYARLAP